MKARRQKRPLDAGDTAPPQPLATNETGKTGPFARATAEAQNRPVTEPPPARGDGAPWIRTPPPEKVDPGMLVPTPPPESVDPGMLIQPQQAESIEAPKGRRAKESKSVLISPEAARYVIERARHHTGRFGIVSFGWQLAAEELKKRATITDGVIRLHPPSALDRFVDDYKKSLRGGRNDVWDFVESTTRRGEWDAAKASGDPDRMTRAAKRLIDEENAQRARSGEPPLPVEQILNPPKGANAPAHANKPITDADKQRAHGEAGKSQHNEHWVYDPNAAHTHPQSNSDVGPGEIASASSSPHANPDAPPDHIVTNGVDPDAQGPLVGENNEHVAAPHERAARLAQEITSVPSELQSCYLPSETLAGVHTSSGSNLASRPAEDDLIGDADPDRSIATHFAQSQTPSQLGLRGRQPDYVHGGPNEFSEDPDYILPWTGSRAQQIEVWPPAAAPNSEPRQPRVPEERFQPGAWRQDFMPTTSRGNVLVDKDHLPAHLRRNLEQREWRSPTGETAGNEELRLGWRYFGSSRKDRHGTRWYHGALDFRGDGVVMPTHARLIKITYQERVGYTLTLDLGDGVQMSLHHMIPSEEVLSRYAAGDVDLPIGHPIGRVDPVAYGLRNDHVHLQINLPRGTYRGRRVRGFVVDPTPFFSAAGWTRPRH